MALPVCVISLWIWCSFCWATLASLFSDTDSLSTPTQAQVRLHWTAWRSDPSYVNYRSSCLSCCWSKLRCGIACQVTLRRPRRWRCSRTRLKTYLFRRCYETVWLILHFPFLVIISPPLRNSGPCNSFYCLGHSKMFMMMMMMPVYTFKNWTVNI